jgi:hypothetical protein
VPASEADCGTALVWPSACVGYSIQIDASAEVDFDVVDELVRRAFDTWQAADCGGGEHPAIVALDLGPVSCNVQEYTEDEKNANAIIFRDLAWPYASGALALTTVTYALESGEIRDADIELNSADAEFTTADSNVEVDLLSILTHETGHFLGLSHTPVAGATMQRDYPPKSTSLREIDSDDTAGICAIYPPGTADSCDPTPVNGLGDGCEEPAPPSDDGEEGCSITRASGGPFGHSGRAGALLIAGLLGATASRLRRRRTAR